MRGWRVDEVIELIKKCGSVALDYYENPPTELKEDHTIVTAADKAIEAIMAERLDRPSEGIFMIGEETVESKDEDYVQAALRGESTWVVDPVDGTAAYANHIPTWGVSIGHMESGVIREGAIFMPVFGEILITDGDKNYHGVNLDKNGGWDMGSLSIFNPPERRIDAIGLVSLSQSITKLGGFDGRNPVQSVSSCVYTIAHLILGHYLGYIADIKFWDVAASLALLRNCGYPARFVSGGEIGLKATNDIYHLDAGDPKRWLVRDTIIFAPSDEALEYLRQRAIMPGDCPSIS